MKKLLICLLAALASFSAMNAENKGYNYMIIQALDGNLTPFELSGLKLTFSGDNLTANLKGEKTNFSLSALNRLYFTKDLSAVSSFKMDKGEVSLDGSSLKIKAPAGTWAKVYDAQGRLVMSSKITDDGTPADVNVLKQGVYLVKAGKTITKISVK